MSPATTSFTDRYVAAVGRHVREPRRAEISAQVRASIDADIAARVAGGATPEAAERDALLALGDPDRLAAGYTGRPLHLIGPALYLDWLRLLRLLLTIVLPIVAVTLVFVQSLAALSPVDILLSTLSTVVSVGIGMAFWTTAVFAILERVRAADAPLSTWDPDDLPAPVVKPDVGIGDLVGGVLAVVLLIGGILWQATASPFVDANGAPITLLDPDLWPWWIPYFIAVMVGELLFAVVLYHRGYWSVGLAAVNFGLNAAFTVPFVTLLLRDEIVNPVFSAEFVGTGLVTGLVVLGEQAAIGISFAVTAIAIWDSIDGALKAVRAQR